MREERTLLGLLCAQVYLASLPVLQCMHPLAVKRCSGTGGHRNGASRSPRLRPVFPSLFANDHFRTYAANHYVYYSDCDRVASPPGSPSTPFSEDSEKSAEATYNARIVIPPSETLPRTLYLPLDGTHIEAGTATKTFIISHSRTQSGLASAPITDVAPDRGGHSAMGKL